MKWFLIIITLVLGAGYMGYERFVDYLVTSNEEKCVAAVAGNDIFSTNNDELCGCVAGFMRENPFFDKESMDFKSKFSTRLTNCMNVHVAKYGIKQCADLKAKVRKSYNRNLDCACFGRPVIKVVADNWVAGGDRVESKKLLKYNVLNHCIK